jgi:outer membrane protein
MKLARIAWIAAAALCAAAGSAVAQESYKIGFVDSQRVMVESRVARQARVALEEEFKKRDQEIAGGPPASVQQRRNALLEEMTLRRDEALKQLVDKANAAIRRIAQDEKFDAVFLEAAYAAPGIDLTARVVKALDSAR